MSQRLNNHKPSSCNRAATAGVNSTSTEAKKYVDPSSNKNQKGEGNFDRAAYWKLVKLHTTTHLVTDLGKLSIPILLLDVRESFDDLGNIVFLAVDLNHLEAKLSNDGEVIDSPYVLEKYSKLSRVKRWDADKWEDEICESDLLLMTPEIFNIALERFPTIWNHIKVVIFDEIYDKNQISTSSEYIKQYDQIIRKYEAYQQWKSQVKQFNHDTRLVGLTGRICSAYSGSEVERLQELLAGKSPSEYASAREELISKESYLGISSLVEQVILEVKKDECSLNALFDQVVDGVLSRFKLAPLFGQLESLSGAIFENKDKVAYSFEPKLGDIENHLSRNAQNRMYKLIKLELTPQISSQAETDRFFQVPALGIVLDSRTSLDFIPNLLHSPYGQFKVQTKLVTSNLSISKSQHNVYLGFTLRLLRYCLSLRDIEQNALRNHAMFYIIPLDSNSEPLQDKINKSFRITENREINVDDIVKLKDVGQKPNDGKFLVQAIYTEVKVLSVRSGWWRFMFFNKCRRSRRQPVMVKQVVEVKPLSNKFAQIKKPSQRARKQKVALEESLYYPDNSLLHFESDAASVFQACLLPEIIYELYLRSTAASLDRKFLQDTQHLRNTIKLSARSSNANGCENHPNCSSKPSLTSRQKVVAKSQIKQDRGMNANLNLSSKSVVRPAVTNKVDRSIEPPTKFDGDVQPLVGATRMQSVLEALTLHKTTNKSEVIEALGDSFLKYIVSVVLFRALKEGDEGQLSKFRERLTCSERFMHLTVKSSLGSYAITRPFSPELFAFALGKELNDKKGLCNEMRPKDLMALVRSIIGTYLVHHGPFEAVLAIKWLGIDIFKGDTFRELNERAVVFSPVDFSPSLKNPNVKSRLQQEEYLRKFEHTIGYEFQDKSFLVQAFTHRSYQHRVTASYERIEFLGDALLNYLVSVTLVSITLERSGYLSTLRSINRCKSRLLENQVLSEFAERYSYHLYLRRDSDFELLTAKTRSKLLGDVFESVAAAIYLDSSCSLDTVWSVYYPMMKDRIDYEWTHSIRSPLAILRNRFPGKDRIRFVLSSATSAIRGPDNGIASQSSNTFIACCIIAGVGSYKAQGTSNRNARLEATIKALDCLPPQKRIDELNRQYQASKEIKLFSQKEEPVKSFIKGKLRSLLSTMRCDFGLRILN